MYGQTNANDAQGVATLEDRVSAVEADVSALESGKTPYQNIGQISGVASVSGAMKKAWESIVEPYTTVVGRFDYGGIWSFIGCRYEGNQNGMLLAFRYDGVTRLMSVFNGTTTYYNVSMTTI